nr:hypothetical protein [Desulfobacterales bacterium]
MTKRPRDLVENFRLLLKGGAVVGCLEECFDVVRSPPYGHVAGVLGTLRKIGLEGIIGGKGVRGHPLSAAMIVARVIDPQSKLGTARGLRDESLFSCPWRGTRSGGG